MRAARAFIFAAEEDFGIVPLEAQSEGTPVIALGRGGARETIVATGATPTGMFFHRPVPAEIADAVKNFLRTAGCYQAAECWRNAGRFSEARFTSAFDASRPVRSASLGRPSWSLRLKVSVR